MRGFSPVCTSIREYARVYARVCEESSNTCKFSKDPAETVHKFLDGFSGSAAITRPRPLSIQALAQLDHIPEPSMFVLSCPKVPECALGAGII